VRILHTADWHIGKRLGRIDRDDEAHAAVGEVVDAAARLDVDLVVVAGDLFDRVLPPFMSLRVVLRALVDLAATGARVVAIPGNHDSAARWDALRPLLEPLRVRVVPFVAPPDRGSAVEIAARAGDESAIVACVPFVPERMFGTASSLFAGSERWAQDYAQGMGDLLSLGQPLAVRTFDLGGGMAAKDRQIAAGSPALAVLGTTEERPEAWLRAGQALARVLLTARAADVWASFLNQPIEVPALRPRLRDLLGLEGHPQLLLRLGHGRDVRPSPRRPVEEVLRTGAST
jgi:hypothetical protein